MANRRGAAAVSPLTAAQRQLVAANLDLAPKVAWTGARSAIGPHALSREEAEAAGFLGLCEAAIPFDPEKGEFRFFAYRRVQGSILDACANRDLIRVTRYGREKLGVTAIPVLSLDAPVNAAEDAPTLHELLPAAGELEEQVATWDAFRQLPSAQRMALEQILAGYTLEEVSLMTGYGRKTLDRLLAQAQRNLLAALDMDTGEKTMDKNIKIQWLAKPTLRSGMDPLAPDEVLLTPKQISFSVEIGEALGGDCFGIGLAEDHSAIFFRRDAEGYKLKKRRNRYIYIYKQTRAFEPLQALVGDKALTLRAKKRGDLWVCFL